MFTGHPRWTRAIAGESRMCGPCRSSANLSALDNSKMISDQPTVSDGQTKGARHSASDQNLSWSTVDYLHGILSQSALSARWCNFPEALRSSSLGFRGDIQNGINILLVNCTDIPPTASLMPSTPRTFDERRRLSETGLCLRWADTLSDDFAEALGACSHRNCRRHADDAAALAHLQYGGDYDKLS